MIDFEPACHLMTELLAGVTDDQLGRPTPCSDYTVADLIEHIDVVAVGFGSVARKESEPDEAAGEAAGEDTAERVRALGQAWGDPAAWQGSSPAAGIELPNELWGRIAFTEIVVHGWDLAKATGQRFELPEKTLRACLDHVAEFVPNAPIPELWGTPVEVPDDAPLIDRIVAITGRTP